MGLGYISLQQFKKGKLCKPATILSLIIAAGLTFVMAKRFQKTGKVFPALVFALLSGVMTVYYVWNLTMGPAPKAKKGKKAKS